MNKKYIIILIGICMILAGIFFYKNQSGNKDIITLYGNIEIRQVNLSFQVGGKIQEMKKEEGDYVKSGELLALLDNKDYADNYRIAQATVLQTKAILEDNRLKYERSKQLLSDKAISQQTFDTAKYAFDQAKANYDAAIAQESYTKNQLAYTKLTAPEDGIITVRVAEPGATVGAGQNVYTLSKHKPVWVRAFVNETELGNIRYGMKAQIQTDSKDLSTNKPKTYTGTIGYISPVAEFTPKTVQSTDLRTNLVYRIRVYVDEVDDFLRQGMPTTIIINLKSDGTGNN